VAAALAASLMTSGAGAKAAPDGGTRQCRVFCPGRRRSQWTGAPSGTRRCCRPMPGTMRRR